VTNLTKALWSYSPYRLMNNTKCGGSSLEASYILSFTAEWKFHFMSQQINKWNFYFILLSILLMSEGRFSMAGNTDITREMCSVVYGFTSSDQVMMGKFSN